MAADFGYLGMAADSAKKWLGVSGRVKLLMLVCFQVANCRGFKRI